MKDKKQGNIETRKNRHKETQIQESLETRKHKMKTQKHGIKIRGRNKE